MELIFLFIYNNSKILLLVLLISLQPIISYINLWLIAAILFTDFYLQSYCLSTQPYKGLLGHEENPANTFCLPLVLPSIGSSEQLGHSTFLGIKLWVTAYILQALCFMPDISWSNTNVLCLYRDKAVVTDNCRQYKIFQPECSLHKFTEKKVRRSW